jgi:AraC-like DNA-binding protein
VLGFGHTEGRRNVRYDWHAHPFHQLLYAVEGTACVEVGKARYFLPPQRAAWISAGTQHRTTISNVVSASVFLHPRLMAKQVESIRIFAAPPLLQEMVKYAARWHPQEEKKDLRRDLYFHTFAMLCEEWLQEEMPYWLPSCDHPQIVQALEYTQQHLQEVTVVEASAAAAMSIRTFRRYFTEEMGMPWREYVTKLRLLQAMELLAQPGARVIEVAGAIGFDSPSAFSKAFLEFTAETPSQYYRRVHERA